MLSSWHTFINDLLVRGLPTLAPGRMLWVSWAWPLSLSIALWLGYRDKFRDFGRAWHRRRPSSWLLLSRWSSRRGLFLLHCLIILDPLQHVMLGLRSVLKYILPELPEWLAAEIARAEHCRREMQCKGSSPRTTPPSPHSSTSMSHEQSTPDLFDKNEHNAR